MPTPVKNLIDPVGITRLAPQGALSPAPPGARLIDVASLVPTGPDYRIMVAVSAPISATQGRSPRVPLPPMGRLLLLTFPPIYKERNQRKFGQFWPLKL